MKDLAGKVALITGGASGIGRSMVAAFADRGMRVVAADIDADGLRQVPGAAMTAVLDTRDRAAWSDLVARVEADLGPVQLLCNNAGVTAMPTPLLDLDPTAFDWVIDVNTAGPYNGSVTVGRRLRELGLPGHIVNTSSVQGLFAAAGFGAYNAAKFSVVGLSETLRMELAPLNIGVSVLFPGPTRTGMMTNSNRLSPVPMAAVTGAPRPGFDAAYQTADQVAAKVVEAVLKNRFFVLSHPAYRPILEARHAAMIASLDPATPEEIDNIRQVEAGMLQAYADMAAIEESGGAG